MLWFCRRSWRLNIDLRRLLCIFGSHTFAQITFGCARNKHMSHSVQRKLRLFLLMLGLRMDGIPALDLWDLVIEVFLSSPNQWKKSKGRVQGNLLSDTPSNKHTHHQTKTPIRRTRSLPIWCDAAHFEDNESVIKWSSMAEVQQWDTYPNPQSFAWLVI